MPFIDDFTARKGEDEVDRKALLRALTAFLKANNLKADWEGIENAPNEALVNALAMMSPYDAAEKQAMLEAPDLKTRAEILVAVTEIELAKSKTLGRNTAAMSRHCEEPMAERSKSATKQSGAARTRLLRFARNDENDIEAPIKAEFMMSTPADRPADSVDPKLLEILVCPLTKCRSNTTPRSRN